MCTLAGWGWWPPGARSRRADVGWHARGGCGETACPQRTWGRDAGRPRGKVGRGSAARPEPASGSAWVTLWGIGEVPTIGAPRALGDWPAGRQHGALVSDAPRCQDTVLQPGQPSGARHTHCHTPCPAMGSSSQGHTVPRPLERHQSGEVTGLQPQPPRGTEGGGRAKFS